MPASCSRRASPSFRGGGALLLAISNITLLAGVLTAGLVSYFIFTKYRRFQAAQRRQNQRILSNLIKENGAGQGYFIRFTKFQVLHCMA